jgi:hypothetical protein
MFGQNKMRKAGNRFRVAVAAVCLMGMAACGVKPDPNVAYARDPESAIATISMQPWPTNITMPGVDIQKRVVPQLDAGDIPALEKQGYAGDPESARLLAQYYREQGVDRAIDAHNWLTIAAENGSIQAAGILAGEFESWGGEDSCLRAKFWHERALRLHWAASGEVSATHLANLQGLADTWSGCVKRREATSSE